MSNSHPLRPLASVSEIDHIHLLSEQLGALVQGEDYSDVTFIVEGKRFPAHRVILAARCHYFRWTLTPIQVQADVSFYCRSFTPPCFITNITILKRP